MSKNPPRHPMKADKPRLLHRNPGGGRADYTDVPALAAKGEPEAVDAETANDFAKENRARFDVVRAEEQQRRKVRSLLGRLRTVAIAQTKAGEDPTSVLEKAVEQLEREKAS